MPRRSSTAAALASLTFTDSETRLPSGVLGRDMFLAYQQAGILPIVVSLNA